MTSTTRSRRVPSRAPLRVLTTLVLATVATTGCSGPAAQQADPSTPATSSTSGTTSSDSSSDSSSGGSQNTTGQNATGQAKAVKFAECIRAHGVKNFPDPDPDGDFTFGVDVTPTVWIKAVNACKSLQPPGTLSGNRNPQQQAAALEFARCMRENGVRDFPDPANGDPLIDTYKIPSANRDGGMAILNAAAHKCGAFVERAAGHQP